MLSAKCVLCGEWFLCPSTPWPDPATLQCGECLYAINETRRTIADEADAEEQPTQVLSAQNAQPLHPSTPEPDPADERPECEPVPDSDSYCALAYLVYLENGSFVFTPAGEPIVCDAHMALIHAAFVEKYREHLEDAPVAAMTRIKALDWIDAAKAQAERIATRLSH